MQWSVCIFEFKIQIGHKPEILFNLDSNFGSQLKCSYIYSWTGVEENFSAHEQWELAEEFINSSIKS